MLKCVTHRVGVPRLKCNVRYRKDIPYNTAHQRAGIGDPAGGLAIAFRALQVAVFRIVAGDDDALLGAAVVNFSHTIGIIAVDDTFRAGEIGRVENTRRRRGMCD